MTTKERNEIAKEISLKFHFSLKGYKELVLRLDADGKYRQLISGQDILNVYLFLKSQYKT